MHLVASSAAGVLKPGTWVWFLTLVPDFSFLLTIQRGGSDGATDQALLATLGPQLNSGFTPSGYRRLGNEPVDGTTFSPLFLPLYF